MSLKIKIDPSVSFELKGGRVAALDAWEFKEFARSLHEQLAKEQTGADGQPTKVLLYADIRQPVIDYVREHASVEILPWEADALFDQAYRAWEEVQKNWQEAPQGASPNLSPSTDARYAD